MRLLIVVLFLFLTASAANAYIVVLRDGRYVEIPSEFTVTNSTLTYEAGQGIQITIQLQTIDVAATERANGQPSGSLLMSGSTPKPAAIRQKRTRAVRSITNQDLEAYRRVRVQNEIASEKKRKELGLPSAEEWRHEAAEIQERTQQQLLSMRAQEQDAEEYWRGRASPLRAEIAAAEAQINYVQRRIDEISPPNSFGGLSTALPFGNVGAPFSNFPFQNLITPNVFGPSLVNTGFRANFGNTGRRPVFRLPNAQVNRGPANRGLFHRIHGRGFTPFAQGSLLALPYQTYDNSWELNELVNQMNELQMQHAGLKARFRDLEQEARTAGAYPGWLRP